MSTMSLPSALPSLSTREAVADVIYRAIDGIDTVDRPLFDSAFTADATFDVNGTMLKGLAALGAGIYDRVGAKLDTTHCVTNVRVQAENGASTAKATATVIAQHYRRGEGTRGDAPRWMAGVLYYVDCVRDDVGGGGLWKAMHWKLTQTWGEGDRTILTEI